LERRSLIYVVISLSEREVLKLHFYNQVNDWRLCPEVEEIVNPELMTKIHSKQPIYTECVFMKFDATVV